ncbi:dTDP-glucose 4,6-dehydratase [Luteolibacter yonseiensis]
MRILVTGGAGFIGSNLVHHLLGEASSGTETPVERVVTLDKFTYAGSRMNLADLESDPRHVLVEGDICDTELVGRLLREHEIDAIMHLAAESHVDRSIDNPEEFIMTNFVGTYRLLEAFRVYLLEHGGENRVFLHVSTDEVFGSLGADDPPFCETTRYAPNSPYSATKAGSDHLVRAYHHTYGLPVVTTHCSNNYGPYQFPEKLLPLMIGKVLKGEPLPIYGDGSQIRDWLYVEDHCRGLVSAMRHGKRGECYVIGGKCEMRNIDVVRELVEAVRERVPGIRPADELIIHVQDRPGHDLRYAIDPSRIETELGWAPRENFPSGLRRTVEWYLANDEWVRHIEEGPYHGERLGRLAQGDK